MNPLEIEVIRQLILTHNILIDMMLPVELDRKIVMHSDAVTIGYNGKTYGLLKYRFIFEMITGLIGAIPARSSYS